MIGSRSRYYRRMSRSTNALDELKLNTVPHLNTVPPRQRGESMVTNPPLQDQQQRLRNENMVTNLPLIDRRSNNLIAPDRNSNSNRVPQEDRYTNYRIQQEMIERERFFADPRNRMPNRHNHFYGNQWLYDKDYFLNGPYDSPIGKYFPDRHPGFRYPGHPGFRQFPMGEFNHPWNGMRGMPFYPPMGEGWKDPYRVEEERRWRTQPHIMGRQYYEDMRIKQQQRYYEDMKPKQEEEGNAMESEDPTPTPSMLVFISDT